MIVTLLELPLGTVVSVAEATALLEQGGRPRELSDFEDCIGYLADLR